MTSTTEARTPALVTEYERGFEYGAHPDRHVHEYGCGHSGEGIDPEFLLGWRAGRADVREQAARLTPDQDPE